MHNLGFSHEHNRPDRDNYWTVNWSNLKVYYRGLYTTYDFLLNCNYEQVDMAYAYWRTAWGTEDISSLTK